MADKNNQNTHPDATPAYPYTLCHSDRRHAKSVPKRRNLLQHPNYLPDRPFGPTCHKIILLLRKTNPIFATTKSTQHPVPQRFTRKNHPNPTRKNKPNQTQSLARKTTYDIRYPTYDIRNTNRATVESAKMAQRIDPPKTAKPTQRHLTIAPKRIYITNSESRRQLARLLHID